MVTKVNPPRWFAGLVLSGTLLHAGGAADFFEDFTQPPDPARWRTHGDASLFQWHPAGHLDVTWDSRRTNSYFLRPLNHILGKHDDFALAFDLTLRTVQPGVTPAKPNAFEIALGFIRVADATHTNFFRGQGTGTVKNLVEFDWFPNAGFGATLWPAVWSTNATLSYRGAEDFTLIALPLNTRLQVGLSYTAANRTLRTTITTNGVAFGPINDLVLAPGFTDFRVDAFAICSYSDAGTSSSLLATGELDNVRLTLPPAPMTDLALVRNGDTWHARFVSRTNWVYQLERTTAFATWVDDGSETNGTGGVLVLPINEAADQSFWRVRAERP